MPAILNSRDMHTVTHTPSTVGIPIKMSELWSAAGDGGGGVGETEVSDFLLPMHED